MERSYVEDTKLISIFKEKAKQLVDAIDVVDIQCVENDEQYNVDFVDGWAILRDGRRRLVLYTISELLPV
jgi:hypothetical protein